MNIYVISFIKKTSFIMVFILSIIYGYAQHDSDNTVFYSGGEIYKLMQNEGDSEITKIPYGKIRYISYDKFYKSYVIAFRNQFSPPNSSFSMNFEYIGEVKVNGKKYPSYKLWDTGVKYYGGVKAGSNGNILEMAFSPLPKQSVPFVVYHLVGFEKN